MLILSGLSKWLFVWGCCAEMPSIWAYAHRKRSFGNLTYCDVTWRFGSGRSQQTSSSLDCLLPAICGRAPAVSTWRKAPLRLVRGELNPQRLSKPSANQTPGR